MVIRVILILFISGVSGISYLAGFARLMSGLLIGFGSLFSLFFGLLFILPEQSKELWFPVYGEGSPWPFFLLALILAVMASLLFTSRSESVRNEKVSSHHFQCLIGGFFASVFSVFLPTFFWFPSEEKRISVDPETLFISVLVGTCIYLVGTVISLILFYKASKGGTEDNPDLMRRLVLTFFSVLHLDKLPPFVAFLMIYSPESKIIYPGMAALALAGYIPVCFFLLKLSWQTERMGDS